MSGINSSIIQNGEKKLHKCHICDNEFDKYELELHFLSSHAEMDESSVEENNECCCKHSHRTNETIAAGRTKTPCQIIKQLSTHINIAANYIHTSQNISKSYPRISNLFQILSTKMVSMITIQLFCLAV